MPTGQPKRYANRIIKGEAVSNWCCWVIPSTDYLAAAPGAASASPKGATSS